MISQQIVVDLGALKKILEMFYSNSFSESRKMDLTEFRISDFAQPVKNSPAMQETQEIWVQSLVRELGSHIPHNQ